MTKRLLPSLPFILTALSLLAGCTGGPVPASPTEPPPTITPLPPTDTPTPIPPSATSTLPPTTTPTTAPPTTTPTRTPLPVTNTPKPTQPPPPTKAPATLPPPRPPGVDLVAPRGKESCVNKFVPATYGWTVDKIAGVGMYYWDESWSAYPGYARPNIKFESVKGICNEKNECRGFTADFCVYVDADAPSGGVYDIEVTIVIASGSKWNKNVLTRVKAPFSWRIE